MNIRHNIDRRKNATSELAPSTFAEPAENVASSVFDAPQSAGHSFSKLSLVQPQSKFAVDESRDHYEGTGLIQAKLAISQPGDPSEEEADRVADHVMGMPEAVSISSRSRTIQRKCACDEDGVAPCPKCEEQEKVQRKQESVGNTRQATPATQSRVTGLRGGGQSLLPSLREFFEPRFGHDFSQVRVHTDARAGQSAVAMQAHAYAVGSDIAFAPGQYAPSTSQGKRLIAHELAHVVQQSGVDGDGNLPSNEIVQRDTPTPAPAPPASVAPPAAVNAPPDGATQLIEQEKKSYELANARVGQRAATVWFAHCPDDTREKPETEDFTIQALVRRPPSDPDRRGFDAEGPAVAFASLQGGDGSVVLQQDQFFFVGRLNAGQHLLQRAAPDTIKDERKMWMQAGQNLALSLVNPLFGAAAAVYQAGSAIRQAATTRPSGARYLVFADQVVAVLGRDGTRFPKTYCLLGNEASLDQMPTTTPDPKTGLPVPRTDVAAPPEAKDLRAIAGIPAEGKKPDDKPKLNDEVEIPPEQQDQFILSYFRARGAEALASNEAMVDKLAEEFTPTTQGSKDKPGSGVSASAKALIDAGRELGANFEKLLDQEASLNAQLQTMKAELMRSRSVRIPEEKLVYEVKGEKKHLDDWIAKTTKDQDQVTSDKNKVLSKSPVLALMVDRQTPSSRVISPMSGSSASPARVTPDSNPYRHSLLAKDATPQNDEAIRAEFNVKLDGVRKAIRHARAQMLTKDVQYLMGMEGLRNRVEADFQGITGKNAGLKTRVRNLLQQRDINHETFEIGTMVIQTGLMFVPGGQVLSAAMGFVMAVQGMRESADRWDVSQATVDPAKALVDQQQAETALVFSTVILAISAVDLATSVNQALGVAGSAGKASAAGTAELHGIPDAYQADVFHELKSGPLGPERCSPTCLLFGRSLSERGKFVQGNAGAAKGELQKRAFELQARGDSISIRGQAISKLPASERAAAEKTLLNEAYETEMRMVELEHEVMPIAGGRLPASYKGHWENVANPGNGRWYPNPDHPAYKFCGEKGIPYHNGYPNFSELQLPGGDVNLLRGKKVVIDGVERDVGMLGTMSDFEIADALAAQQTGMKDGGAFREWRLNKNYTWHHRENGVTMQLVPTELHASIPHEGGARLQRGIPVP